MRLRHYASHAPPRGLEASGAPGQAFQALLDEATDQKIERLESLSAEVDGRGAEFLRALTAMALAVPQLGKAKVGVEMDAALDLTDGTQLEVRYTGPWDRYRPLHDIVARVKPEELQGASGTLRLRFAFSDGITIGGPHFDTLRDVFVQLNPGSVRLRAELPKVEA